MSSFTLLASVIEIIYIVIFCSCQFVRVSLIIHYNPQIATVFIIMMGDAGFFTAHSSSFAFSCLFLFPLFFSRIIALVFRRCGVSFFAPKASRCKTT